MSWSLSVFFLLKIPAMQAGGGAGSSLGHLTPQQQSRVMARLDELQMQDSMNTFNGLVERCFSECVISFRAKDLDDNEKQCVHKCVHKFMGFSQRVGQRFAEKNQQPPPA